MLGAAAGARLDDRLDDAGRRRGLSDRRGRTGRGGGRQRHRALLARLRDRRSRRPGDGAVPLRRRRTAMGSAGARSPAALAGTGDGRRVWATRVVPRMVRASTCGAFFTVLNVLLLGFGAYLVWRGVERDRRAGAAESSGEVAGPDRRRRLRRRAASWLLLRRRRSTGAAAAA